MGILNIFSKSAKAELIPLPSGSFTLDRDGKIMTSTLPRGYPESNLLDIGQKILEIFKSAKESKMPLHEVTVHYNALKLLARELRGGAIIFLRPQSFSNNQNKKS